MGTKKKPPAIRPHDGITKRQLDDTYFLKSKSSAFLSMMHFCEQVADSNTNVLLIGESGTGKEVAARYIHACSSRAAHPFVAVNCSAYTESLLESELFGYEQGAFTGAVKSRIGRFELSDHGTLFADEVGDINMITQVKLLRAIETKVIERIGSNVSRPIEFRLLSATNKDLVAEVAAGRFREDFFYRISTIVIEIPPLRKRREDLEDLINFFLLQSQEENGKNIIKMEPEVVKFLMEYDYPGNVRELRNIIDRMVVLSEKGVITKSGLPILYNLKTGEKAAPPKSGPARDRIVPWREFKRDSERDYLQWVLEQTCGNVAEAARALELSPRQLFNKIGEYGLHR